MSEAVVSSRRTSAALRAQISTPARRRVLLINGVLLGLGFLLATGLYLYLFADLNWNAGQVVLALHMGAGTITAMLFVLWMADHLMPGIRRAANRVFFWTSWVLFGAYAATLITGMLIALPFALYLTGVIWFYRFETYDLLGNLHLVLALATVASMALHLVLSPRGNATGNRTDRGKAETS